MLTFVSIFKFHIEYHNVHKLKYCSFQEKQDFKEIQTMK